MSGNRTEKESNYINPFGNDLNCYKVNLHTHSPTSDGKLTWAELGHLYSSRGYDIVAMTDHYKSNLIPKDDSGITWLSGMEIHPAGPRGLLLHLVALNVPDNFENPSEKPVQEAINAVRAAGGECIMAHPYWSSLTSEDIMAIKNIIGMEVYNTSTRYIGKALNMQLWDELLEKECFLPAVAVDDTHNPRDLFHGWSMICAENKSAAAIVDAIRKGMFYSTMGPEFYRIEQTGRKLSFEFSPCVEAVITCNGSNYAAHFGPGGDATVINGELVSSGKSETTVIEAEITEHIKYARCQIRDKNGHYAWSNPFVF